MYVDALGRVSNAQALTATAASTDSVDTTGGLISTPPAIGTGEPLGFALAVDVAADFTTMNETYQVNVVSSANADLSSPTILSERILTAAQLTAGALFFFELPIGTPAERYIGLQYVLAGTTPTVTVTAWLTHRDLFSMLARSYRRSYAV